MGIRITCMPGLRPLAWLHIKLSSDLLSVMLDERLSQSQHLYRKWNEQTNLVYTNMHTYILQPLTRRLIFFPLHSHDVVLHASQSRLKKPSSRRWNLNGSHMAKVRRTENNPSKSLTRSSPYILIPLSLYHH